MFSLWWVSTAFNGLGRRQEFLEMEIKPLYKDPEIKVPPFCLFTRSPNPTPGALAKVQNGTGSEASRAGMGRKRFKSRVR